MKLPAITFNQQALNNFNELIKKEWLITNGLGGYASSTVMGINTRKYHGLLVAALNPPGDRTVCLSKLDEDLFLENEVFRLGSNEFNDTIYPKGYKFIKQFSINPFPTHTYSFDDLELNKTIFMHRLKNATSAIYKATNKSSKDAKLSIYPMVTCRYYHHVLDQQKNPINLTQKPVGNQEIQLTFQDQQTVINSHITRGIFKEKPNWVDRLHYRDEESRGETSNDDCYQPGTFELTLPANQESTFALTTIASRTEQENMKYLQDTSSSIEQINTAYDREISRLSDLVTGFYGIHNEVPVSDWLNWILQAADAFIVQNFKGREAVIAGYHWFEPWGRDTFISLPGLTLVNGRFREAENILSTFIQYDKDGVIPNFITDESGEPAYNTVDGTLWYINAVLQYLKYTGNFAYVKQNLWSTLKSIIIHHEKGTLFNIHLENDGLLAHGSRLTWMDAVVEGDEITPRTGKAVEIQALWYNALKIMELLATQFGETELAAKYTGMAEKTRKTFNQKYWNPQKACLYDVLEQTGIDASIRPNQIFSISMDYSILDSDKARSVVDLVSKELLTPYGLRTLSLDDPKYVGVCAGNRRSRDTAYHNGTIWPWLLGPYITAYLKAYGSEPETRDFALKNLIIPLFSVTIHSGGLGTVNEIFDCDSPNEPRGCIAQAWSIAEPLRAYVEDVLAVKPKFEAAIKFRADQQAF